jgi:hypothetical protein
MGGRDELLMSAAKAVALAAAKAAGRQVLAARGMTLIVEIPPVVGSGDEVEARWAMSEYLALLEDDAAGESAASVEVDLSP